MSTAKKIAKRDSKPKTTKSVTKLSGATMTREQGYGSHKERFSKVEGTPTVRQGRSRGRLDTRAQASIESEYAAKLVRCVEAAAEQKQNKVETNSSAPPVIRPDGLSATSETAYP